MNYNDNHKRLPDWIRIRANTDQHSTKGLLRRHRLSTVCEEARCPNRPACFSKPTATFMILGSTCTRNCGFCSVNPGIPSVPDKDEPLNVARAALEMGLKYVVITSVTRDDLEDDGAGQFAETIRAVRGLLPHAKIEVLTPDFQGNVDLLKVVLDAHPDVYNHNMETVRRLYPSVRRGADYERSLLVLGKIKSLSAGLTVKSGFMLGLGETMAEIVELLNDLRSARCDFITIGQYLRPSRKNIPVVEYIRPEVFEELRLTALGMGFRYVVSGPLVRSSMNAEEMYEHV